MKNQKEKRKQIWGKDLKNNKEMRGTLTELGFSECGRPRDSSRARPGEALLRRPLSQPPSGLLQSSLVP